MTLRITASPITFAASQSAGAKAVSTVANLLEYVSSTVELHPTALTLVETADTAILVTEIVLRSEKNPNEVAHRLYKGPAVYVGAVMGSFGRDALKNAMLTSLALVADHGMELEFTYESGGTPLTAGTILWDVQNQPLAEFGKKIAEISAGGVLQRQFGGRQFSRNLRTLGSFPGFDPIDEPLKT